MYFIWAAITEGAAVIVTPAFFSACISMFLLMLILRLCDEIKDKAADSHPETAAEEFDTEFAVMTLEIKSFIQALEQAFGFEA